MELSFICQGGPLDGFTGNLLVSPGINIRMQGGASPKRLSANARPPYELYSLAGQDSNHKKRVYIFRYERKVGRKKDESDRSDGKSRSG